MPCRSFRVAWTESEIRALHMLILADFRSFWVQICNEVHPEPPTYMSPIALTDPHRCKRMVFLKEAAMSTRGTPTDCRSRMGASPLGEIHASKEMSAPLACRGRAERSVISET